MNISDENNQPRPAIDTDPLPQPGESLHWEIIDLFFGRVMCFAMIFTVMVLATAMEWYRYLFHVLPTRQGAIAYTVLTAILGIVTLYFFRKMAPRARALKLGYRGERHVGHYLNDMCRGLNYRVLHDIPANDFNIDHVLIGPGGIFAIETKNWSKPPKGTTATLTFDGNTLTKPNGSFDPHPPAQARANADFLRQLLAKRTARDPRSIPIHPVLIFPGWWINDETQPRPRTLWVLPDNALHKWLPNEPRRLKPEDVALFHESIAEYTRNFKK